MQLKVAGVPDRLGEQRTDGDADALVLGQAETGACAANAALHLDLDAASIDGCENAVEIIKGLAVIERTVALLGGLEVDFGAHAVVFVEHDVSAETQEEPVERRGSLAERIEGAGNAGAKGICGVQIVNTRAI